MIKTSSLLAVCLLLLTTLMGCSSATPVKPAPMQADHWERLNCLLAGTWEHTSSDDTELFEAARNAYVLNADGTGHVEPNSGSQAMFGLSGPLAEYQWSLDGRNLHMRRSDGKSDVFRVDSWDPDKMTWFYYNASMDYGVTRRGDSTPSCP